MGTKYFSKEELENYRDQELLSHGEMIDSDAHGIIYRAVLSLSQGHHYAITYTITHDEQKRVFRSGEYREVYPVPIPRPDTTVMSPEIIEAFAARVSTQESR